MKKFDVEITLENFGCEIADLSNLLDHHVIVLYFRFYNISSLK